MIFIMEKKGEFRCPLCSRKFDTIWTLKIHFMKEHKLNNKCPICRKSVRKNLMRHAYHRFVKGDIEHGVLWYLLGGGNQSLKMRRVARNLTEKIVNDLSW